MQFDKKDVDSWRTSLRDYDVKRKSPTHERVERNKIVTNREVKLKDVEFNPILSTYADQKKEEAAKAKESASWNHKAEEKQKKVEKYEQGYDIITCDKVGNGPIKNQDQSARGRIMPAAQVDYNILTNEKLDDLYFKNSHLNVNLKKKNDKKTLLGKDRDFNIVSNKYYKNHDEKSDVEKSKNLDELNKKYWKTHDYNLLNVEYYDKSKETNYQQQAEAETKHHGQKKIDKLPPSIKNREMLIFDHSKDIPEEVKIIDHKKEMAKNRYKLRYKLEEEYKDRDFHNQDVEEKRKNNRQNDLKYSEHLKKGYDVLTHAEIPADKAHYEIKPHYNRWDQLMVESQANFNSKAKSQTNTPYATNNDLSGYRSNPKTTESFVDQGRKSKVTYDSNTRNEHTSSAQNIQSNSNGDNGYKLPQYYDSLKIKDPVQRAREPAFNYADKYNSYARQPEIKKEYQSSILPVVTREPVMNFTVTATGGFKRSIIN